MRKLIEWFKPKKLRIVNIIELKTGVKCVHLSNGKIITIYD